ncbi:MAG: type III pantothenate kinase [Pyrinomonadaceae bacterium]
MLLAIDIGNSLIKFGVFEDGKLIDKFSIATKRDYHSDELHFDRLEFTEGKFLKIDSVVVSTVVPELIDVVRVASQTQFNVTPVFVDQSADFGLKIEYDPPNSVGIDRLINAFAAVHKYGKPVIVCSFGTATTIDAVNANAEFIGGIIAPGMKTMSDALHEKAAQLPAVQIEKPLRLIGNSTESAIRSGVFNGHIAMVEGLVSRFLSDKAVTGSAKKRAKVIATGGFAKLIAKEVKSIDESDENLTLEGLELIAGRSS